MKALNLLAVIFFLGMNTFMNAAVVSGNNPTNPPVELSNDDEVSLFVVMMDQERVFVQWESKMKGVYFEIERSTNGVDYEMIATSKDVVDSSDGTMFQYIDESPEVENYYRVFYITPSGTVDYSDVTFISPLPSDMTIDGLK